MNSRQIKSTYSHINDELDEHITDYVVTLLHDPSITYTDYDGSGYEAIDFPLQIYENNNGTPDDLSRISYDIIAIGIDDCNDIVLWDNYGYRYTGNLSLSNLSVRDKIVIADELAKMIQSATKK